MNNSDYGAGLSVYDYEQYGFTAVPLDDAVIKDAVNGDADAFRRLFMGTYRYVFAVAKKYLRRDDDIYDAIQDTYMRVYKGIGSLQSVSSFYPWLHRVAENCAKDQLKYSAADTRPLDENEDAESYEPSPDLDVTADVTAVLKQLPPEQSELLIRVYYDKMRVAEIARMDNLPVTTVHNRLKSAKRKLRELLQVRGIDKPIYSGEFISMVSTAIRNAIGTELLSLAVAEEILHSVTDAADKKAAFVITAFARKMRNRAAKRIANALMLLTALLTVAAIIAVTVFLNRAFKDKNNGTPVGGFVPSPESLSDVLTSETDSAEAESSALSDSTPSNSSSPSSGEVLSGEISSDNASSKYNYFPMIPDTPVTVSGVLERDEDFGTFSEDGSLPIATTKERVYAISGDALVSVARNASGKTVCHNSNFSSLYTDSGSFLNVYDGRVYWVNKNANSQFVLNRANLDGSEHYSVVFSDINCTYLTKFLVAKDGIYFTAGIHGIFTYTESGTLYRTDLDFKIEKKLSGVADYALIRDKLYYIEGRYNYGDICYANRSTFTKEGSVEADHLSYGTLFAYGDYLVANCNNPYGHTEGGSSAGYRIIDSKTNLTVRRVDGEGDTIKMLDVSGYDGGTLIYRQSGNLLIMNVARGEILDLSSEYGTVFGDYIYHLDSSGLKASALNGKK